MGVPIPHTPDDVTAEWLDAALKASGALRTASVASIEKDPIGVGVGLLGDLLRVEPRYGGDDDAAPSSVIVKLPTHAPHNKAIGMAFQFYERELRFYREVAPGAKVRVPRCWYADMDAETEQFVLVLEDLSHLQLADQVAGVSPARAKLAVEAIAPFHAQWWETDALEALDWMPRADHPITMQAAKLYEDGWPHFVEKWSSVLPPGSLEVGAQVRDAYRHMLTELAVPPRTIVHTDFRLDNLFFGDHEVAVIDWQLSTRSSGVYDVAYFLAQSMDVELRRTHERDIIRAWYDALCAAGVTGYSFEQALDDYAASILVCLVVAVSAGADMDLGNERGEALVRGISERAFSAALDVDWKAVLDRVS
jgi:hypothetical protein